MNNTQPKVSVVIPTYNAARYIAEAIESVLAQSYHDYEIIVVDDGSTDNTKEVLRPYMDRIRYFYKENGGVSSARNRGIQEARGEYIAFLDADDLWLPEKLKLQIEIMEQHPDFAMIHTDIKVIDVNGTLLKESANKRRQSHNGMVFEEFFKTYRSLVMMSSALIRKSSIESMGLFDESLSVSEDYDFFLRFFWNYPVYLLDEPLVKYRITPGSISRSDKVKEVICRKQVIDRFVTQHKDFFDQHQNLVKSKWNDFNFESGLILFYRGNFSQSHSFFKQVLTSNPKAWIYFMITLIPGGLLHFFRNAKRSVVTLRRR